jgi:hypothetical protein
MPLRDGNDIVMRRRCTDEAVVRLAFRDDLYEQLHDLLTSGGWPCDRHPRTFEYDWERRVRRRVA